MIFKKAKTYEMPVGADSLNGVQGALEAILKAAGNEITWIELKKHKLPFATESMKMISKKITSMHFMKPDPRKVVKAETEEDDEPVAAKADR